MTLDSHQFGELKLSIAQNSFKATGLFFCLFDHFVMHDWVGMSESLWTQLLDLALQGLLLSTV